MEIEVSPRLPHTLRIGAGGESVTRNVTIRDTALYVATSRHNAHLLTSSKRVRARTTDKSIKNLKKARSDACDERIVILTTLQTMSYRNVSRRRVT